MKAAFLPVYPNPYQWLLRDALEANGVAVEMLERLPSAQWLRENRGTIDILHYHWLDGLYMQRFRTPSQVLAYLSRFRLARELGYRVVWTAHNILPHRTLIRPLDVLLHRHMMAHADAVITHCEFGRQRLLARFPRRGPVAVIPHGHFKGVYPMTFDLATARARLGLDSAAFVYVAIGNIVAYKGLDRLVEAFNRIAGAPDVLLIAGRNRDNKLAGRLLKAAANDARIRVFPAYIPVEEMQLYLRAADVMVAPFTDILTSSTVITALTFGLPVVVPALGCMPELVTSDAGILYDASRPAALEGALSAIRELDREAMASAARRIADSLDWTDVGRRTATVYADCLAL